MLMDWLAAAWNRAVVVAVAGLAVAVRLQVIRLVGPTAVWVWAEGPKRRATPISKQGRNNFFMMWPSSSLMGSYCRTVSTRRLGLPATTRRHPHQQPTKHGRVVPLPSLAEPASGRSNWRLGRDL